MSTLPSPTRAYPLPAPTPDPRFTTGLIIDVAQLLAAAGYPAPSGSDLTDLSARLWAFLYQPVPFEDRGDPERDVSMPPGGPLPPGIVGWPVAGRREPSADLRAADIAYRMTHPSDPAPREDQ